MTFDVAVKLDLHLALYLASYAWSNVPLRLIPNLEEAFGWSGRFLGPGWA